MIPPRLLSVALDRQQDVVLVRQRARQAALGADWDSQLALFEHRLRAVHAARRSSGVVHAALA